jgi:DNA gyrase/topoisomerase IV subunit A
VPTAENRQQLHERLAILAPISRATNDVEGLLGSLSTAVDEAAATAALRALLECDRQGAVAVLDIQVRRFAVQERQRMSGEIESIRAELEDLPAPVAASGGRPHAIPVPTIESTPRLDQHEQRRIMLNALIQASDEAAHVLGSVSSSDDAASSNEALQARFGWDFVQALTVLDMQLRRLTPFGRQRLVEAMAEES